MPTLTTDFRRPLAQRFLGAAAGVVCALLAAHLNLSTVVLFAPLQSIPLMAALGALLGGTRGRLAVPLAAVALALLAIVVNATPWAGRAAGGLIVDDRLARANAVVVLAADVFADGTPVPQSQRRLDHAYGLLRAGWASRLVLTRFAPPKPSYVPAAREQLRRLGLKAEIVEAGPIRITRDEAAAVARLARERGWQRLILVTDPIHTRRARDLFEETIGPAQIKVLCSPCPGLRPDLAPPRSAPERRAAFGAWLYEAVWYNAHFIFGVA